MSRTPRYKKLYAERIVPALKEKMGYGNVMQVPRLEKIVLNMGVGSVRENPKLMESAVRDMSLISGQKPIVTRARKSISTFKIREGWEVGAKVTLRGARMYDFIDRFINVAVPRIRDFRGFTLKSFDGKGNFSVGIREQVIFPEIKFDETERTRGLDVSIVTTARTDAEAGELLKAFGMPFRER
ncbi:MAG: 50S ribosomal protein L5 [bacterium]